MNDQQEIRDYLDWMAAADPYGTVDGARQVEQGRRARRHRRRFAAGASTAAVVAVLAAGTVLPRALGSGESPEVGPPATGANPSSLSVLSEPEAVRRCEALSNQDPEWELAGMEKSERLIDPGTSQDPARRRVLIGKDDEGRYRYCWLRRNDPAAPTTTPRHTPKADPAAFADPGADDQTLLRACSARTNGLSLAGWRIVARESLARIGTRLVAISPDAGRGVQCGVPAPGSGTGLLPSSAVQVGKPPKALGPHHFEIGGQCSVGSCTGWLYDEAGRVPAKVVRMRLTASNGRTHDVPVKDGWFAVLWADGQPGGQPSGRFTAYDAAGNVVPISPTGS